MPFFSIVTVCFNDLDGLKRTYASVLEQEFPSFEWLVIDGNSKDGTKEFLKGIGLKKANWISERDDGIYDAMNKGVQMSRGDYVVFMNAGDTFVSSQSLSLVGAKLKTNDVDVLYGGGYLVFPNGYRRYRAPVHPEKQIWHGLPGLHQATYYRRSAISHLYDTKYRICGDYYLAASLARDGAIAACLDEPVTDFEAGVGISGSSKLKLFWEPYLIQRDVLGLRIEIRLLSAVRRCLGVFGSTLLTKLP